MLSRYMDQRRVRVYIKDTIMKGYIRARQASSAQPLAALGIDHQALMAEAWERPHGRRLTDGRVIAWGSAEDWKLVLMALHERAWGCVGAMPFGAVLMCAVGRYTEPDVRAMVHDAANKLNVNRVVWLS